MRGNFSILPARDSDARVGQVTTRGSTLVLDIPWEYADARQAAAQVERRCDVLAAEPGCEVVEADRRYVRAVVNVLADARVRDELLTPDD